MLAMMVLASLLLGVVITWLSSVSLDELRSRSTETALTQAREALIAYAVADFNRPGELPCPDTNNNGRIDIGVDTVGSNCTSLIGRLPWLTLGISELRDSSGERLWYAVSNPFHANGSAKLNSETAGDITVSGSINASSVAAVVFAPGTSLSGQNRIAANVNGVAHYLEGTNASSVTAFTLQAASDSFNDRLLPIPAEELFRQVEKRAARELRPLFAKYYADWGRYPFAAPFSNPATSAFVGASGSMEGLLPITSDSTLLSWDAGGSSMTTSGVVVLGGAPACAITGSSLRCSVLVIFAAASSTLTMTGVVNNAGHTFSEPPPAANVTYTGITGVPALFSTSLDATGKGLINATGTAASPILLQTVSITIPIPTVNLAPLPAWFKTNDWHKVTYYALAPGYAPGGTNACSLPASPCDPVGVQPSTACLSICDLRRTANLKANDVRALVTMAGPTLAGLRPSANLSDYLEEGNVTSADYTFERKPMDAVFNDQSIEIFPENSP